MNEEVFNSIQIIGFDNETESYRSLVKTVIVSTNDIINNKAIPYDYEYLTSKIASLKIIQRDGETHEYTPDSNTLYLSLYNKEGKRYSDEEIIIFIVHELMHFINLEKNNDFYSAYYGYDEFFTEYLAFIIISKIGGIRLELYYKENIKGYFGNDKDINFIKMLCNKVDFRELLSSYINRQMDITEKLVGKKTLVSMNDYYSYYDQLSELIGKPLKEFNKIIEHPLFLPQKQIIDNYINDINKNISEHEISRVI